MRKSLLFILLSILCAELFAQGVIFPKDLSPAEGLLIAQESSYREEICLNGYWDVQIMPVPSGWKSGTGIAPELPVPEANNWDKVPIKVPSPINVNGWGNGRKVGEGTRFPYAPSSEYYPSYPEHWDDARMAWLRKSIEIPERWTDKRLILHFEAVAGECIVVVNGKEIARNFEFHLPFEVDITEHVRINASNELRIGLRHSRLFDKSHPDYRYFGATYPSGSNTDNLLGIWQDVFLFALPPVRITDIFAKPQLDKDELELEIQLVNQSSKSQKIKLEGEIKEWINRVSFQKDDWVRAAEIDWELGNTALSVSSGSLQLKPGETQTISIKTKVNDKLKKWSPDHPNLYTLLLQVKNGKNTMDCKAERFGWRQFTIAGNEFHLNGEKIQCFGDIQHPFGAYICSRRFAYAWYQMIKDFGGNAVRPHAQPWPRVYYDLADEMGLMVLDETALFGSSIRLNLEEDITWERSHEHLKRLILRDRNHPSVIGWSAGNEMFAIALLNKPTKEISDKWDEKLVDLTLSAKKYDDTRPFVTLDGDRDMEGKLPVWSKHFAHGLKLEDLPLDTGKPLIVGEQGATYYGRPIQLYPFIGDAAFESYYGRNEALAFDLYQNTVQMAIPYLSYFSPSEVCWFGIEHINLGYSDYSRLPNKTDGIFPAKPYEEGKPGYQFERIPPYVTTFNPGLDPNLPLYKELPMFEALRDALTKGKSPSPWAHYTEHKLPRNNDIQPGTKYSEIEFIGDKESSLYKNLQEFGIQFPEKTKTPQLLFIDAEETATAPFKGLAERLTKIKESGGTAWFMLASGSLSPEVKALLPLEVELTPREATLLNNNKESEWVNGFIQPQLYFAESKEDKKIIKQGLAGELVKQGRTELSASNVDWSLFNDNPENRKCAQIVLYEHLEKPSGAALVTYPYGKGKLVISTLDYRVQNQESLSFWRRLFSFAEIAWIDAEKQKEDNQKKEHDLLMDGPVD